MRIIATRSYHKKLFAGYETLPNLDTEKHPQRPGLDGPIRTRSGKVVYYDPIEGKYYDASTDIYLDYDEYEKLNEKR